MPDNKISAEEVFKKTLDDLGFSGYKQSEMTNSDNWLCTCTAMESYAKELSDQRCKEQREICSTTYHNESIEFSGTWSQGIKEKIRTSPHPSNRG